MEKRTGGDKRMSYSVLISGLTKTFQGNEVVSNVSMHIRKGEIYGFLGPNGAGKTTIMKMLTSLVKPTAGEIEILGHKLTEDSFQVLGRIGRKRPSSGLFALFRPGL